MAQDGSGYLVTPGENDGTADAYAKGDAWVLRYMQGQLDDSSVYRSTSANLDAFVNAQATRSSDVVFWYAGHFDHRSDGRADSGHIVGPTLTPVGW
jgi:hypothetical protein